MTTPPNVSTKYWNISTHTLTWSVTKKFGYNRTRTENFNSHAHVERDEMGLGKISDIKHFNSHAHVERDETSSFYDCENKNFNSHAHVERD